MPANLSGPLRIWQFIATVGDTNLRTPSIGANPYNVNAYYSRALFQLRVIAQPGGNIGVQRVVIYGSERTDGFPAVGLGAADQHVVARWLGNQAVGFGQIRQGKGIDNFIGATRRRLTLIPPFLLLEWNVSAVGTPGDTRTLEVWATFLGPEVVGSQ